MRRANSVQGPLDVVAGLFVLRFVRTPGGASWLRWRASIVTRRYPRLVTRQINDLVAALHYFRFPLRNVSRFGSSVGQCVALKESNARSIR
jgi:hypothetical protein